MTPWLIAVPVVVNASFADSQLAIYFDTPEKGSERLADSISCWKSNNCGVASTTTSQDTFGAVLLSYLCRLWFQQLRMGS